MKQITKKQCEEALKLVERCEYWDYEYWDKFGETEEYQVLEQVVKSYFELLNEYKGCRKELEACYEMMGNPPLKFEELKEGMWVWDNRHKEWCLVALKHRKFMQKRYVNGLIEVGDFEEGRYYRKEVKNER